MSYRLLERFRSLFEGKRYLHRNSSLGDSVAWCLPEDLYELGRSPKLTAGVEAQTRVLNVQNRLQGIAARRGDSTFGELIPQAYVVVVPSFNVARGPVATVEIGTEVKVLAKAMIKQIDRVMTDLLNQKREFLTAGGTPITVGIVGINYATSYVSFEGDREWPTDGKSNKHPFQEAEQAEARLRTRVASDFDEFLVLRFCATNKPPYDFAWIDQHQTEMDYAAVLTRISRKYEQRF